MIDTTKHFKIWFSKNSDEWMPIANRLRLIRHRQRHPDHTIYLVGADRFLSEEAIKKRNAFCQEHQITYLDIDNDLPRLIKEGNDKDVKLLQLANDQLDAFFKVDRENLPLQGNLAAASDALRWVSALLDRGIYSDLDTEIDFQNVPKCIDKELLLVLDKCWDGIDLNNNFIATSGNHPLVEKIRDALIASQSKTLDSDFITSAPRQWVHNLYGPYPIAKTILEYYSVNTMYDWDIKCNAIMDEISAYNAKLLYHSNHRQGAGDISWGTNSQEVMTENMGNARNTIVNAWRQNFLRRSKEAITRIPDDNNNPSRQAAIDCLKQKVNDDNLTKAQGTFDKFDREEQVHDANMRAADFRNDLAAFNKFDTFARAMLAVKEKYHGKSLKRLRSIKEIETIVNSCYRSYAAGTSIALCERILQEHMIELGNKVQLDHKQNGALKIFGKFQPKSRLVTLINKAFEHVNIPPPIPTKNQQAQNLAF